jgi:hypothetical protein
MYIDANKIRKMGLENLMISGAGVSLLLTDKSENSTLVSMQIHLLPVKFRELRSNKNCWQKNCT